MGPGCRRQCRRQRRGLVRLPEDQKRHEPELLIEGVANGVSGDKNQVIECISYCDPAHC